MTNSSSLHISKTDGEWEESQILLFRQKLIEWGQANFRDFPWRHTQDPYRILIAEVMLHRTQAKQVVPIYETFIGKYPNIEALSTARKTDLQHDLYSLGLQWRVGLLHTMAKDVVRTFDGKIPKEKASLLALPGVSEYIASAVRCFAWNEPDALIDTNTVRIIGRLFGLVIKDSSRRNRLFRELITLLVDPYHPREYNYALLDLGAMICTKKLKPAYQICPVFQWCEYGRALSSQEV